MFDDDEEEDFSSKSSVVTNKINEKTSDLNNKLSLILGENKNSSSKLVEKKVEDVKKEIPGLGTSSQNKDLPKPSIKKSIFLDDDDIPFKKEEKVQKVDKIKNEPLKSEIIKSEPIKSEPIKSESIKSEPIKNPETKVEKKVPIEDHLSSNTKSKFVDPLSFAAAYQKSSKDKEKITSVKEIPTMEKPIQNRTEKEISIQKSPKDSLSFKPPFETQKTELKPMNPPEEKNKPPEEKPEEETSKPMDFKNVR